MDRVKVKRTALIARIAQHRKEARAAYKREMEKYNQRFAAWLKKVEDRLIRALDKVQRGEDPTSSRYGYGRVDLPSGRPEKPDSYDLNQLDQDIRFLLMSEEETIIVGLKDRWSRYL